MTTTRQSASQREKWASGPGLFTFWGSQPLVRRGASSEQSRSQSKGCVGRVMDSSKGEGGWDGGQSLSGCFVLSVLVQIHTKNWH